MNSYRVIIVLNGETQWFPVEAESEEEANTKALQIIKQISILNIEKF